MELAELTISQSDLSSQVLELGQALFDTLLDAVAQSQTLQPGDQALDPEPAQAAAAEFFAALRLLLEIAEPAAPSHS